MFCMNKSYFWATSKTCTRTLRNLDPEKHGPRKTGTLKNLEPEKPGPQKNLDPGSCNCKMEVLKSTFLLIKYSVPTYIDRVNKFA